MAKLLVILAVICGFAMIAADPRGPFENIKVEVVSSEKMKEILKANPDAVKLSRKISQVQPIAQEGPQPIAPRYIFEYWMGSRVKGDYLVAHQENYFTWLIPRDCSLTLEYPEVPGTGAVLSYISVLIGQSSLEGQAYIMRGGIGQRFLMMMVEADHTYFFDYVSNFYGKH